MENTFRTLCTKSYQNHRGFIENMTEMLVYIYSRCRYVRGTADGQLGSWCWIRLVQFCAALKCRLPYHHHSASVTV